MKTTIYYFSGTGNSLMVARDLAAEFGGAEIISIPKAIKGSEVTTSSERVGIIYPVYMFGMPLMVTEFIKKLRLNNNQYIFAIATYGGKPGASLQQTAKQLQKQGMKLSTGFGVLMPGNYIPMYGALDPEKQNKMFGKEKKKIREIAAVVKAGKVAEIEKDFFLTSLIFSGIVYNLCSPKIHEMDKSFWADDKCNSCGVCVKVCPAKDIELINGKPKWLRKCEQCFACLQWCPTEAIQCGKSTVGRKRYHHPEVTLKDFINED